jgi:UDP:flavonoid glycosyltransferase YjiC (YdhE family)
MAHGDAVAYDFSAKVHRVLQDPTYRSAAQRIAQSMRRYGGAAESANRIERLA